VTGDGPGPHAGPEEPTADDVADGAREPECPICRAAQLAVAALLAKQAGTDQTGDDINWLTVCTAHAWQLAGQPALARALARARLRSALAALTANLGENGRLDRGLAGAAEGAPCPLCAAMAAAAQAAATGDGGPPGTLCVPHLCIALEQAPGRDRLQALAGAAIADYNALEQELSELIRKSDYRFRDEPRGPEASSWRRAARLLAGAPGVRWSLRRRPEIEG
jgi:hypothetical protein